MILKSLGIKTNSSCMRNTDFSTYRLLFLFSLSYLFPVSSKSEEFEIMRFHTKLKNFEFGWRTFLYFSSISNIWLSFHWSPTEVMPTMVILKFWKKRISLHPRGPKGGVRNKKIIQCNYLTMHWSSKKVRITYH